MSTLPKWKKIKTHLAASLTASWRVCSTKSSATWMALACTQVSVCVTIMWARHRPYWMAWVVALKKNWQEGEGIVSSVVSRIRSEGSVIWNAGAQVLDLRDNNAQQYQTMNDEHGQNPWHDSPSKCVQGNSFVQWCHHQLLHLSKYCMHQQTTVVDQPPFSVVFNAADNALDRFDVSGVQAPSLLVTWNRQQPIHVGENSLNLLNNGQTNVFSLLRFKFVALGNGDDNNVQKLPEECF